MSGAVQLASRAELEAAYEDAIRAAVPRNLSFDFERTLSALQAKRDVAFLLGLLSDSENEAALCLELAEQKLAADPTADVATILEEGWYYLRTSIDVEWQLDEGPVPARAMIAYLAAVLRARAEPLRREQPRAVAFEPPEARANLLRRLRAELM